MTEKIKACPYCPVPTVTMVFNPDGDDAFVECSRCKTQGPSGKNEAEAIAKWNAAANALEQKDAEIARLTAALADTEEQRHETVSKLSLSLIREANGDKRQDELEAEIARLTAACDDLEGEYLRMKEQRDEALATRDAAVSKLSEMRTMWIGDVKMLQDRNGILLNQRDEARKVARVWYNAAGVWKERYEANDIDAIEDELMQYCQQQQARKVITHPETTGTAGKYQFWYDSHTGQGYIIDTTLNEPQSVRVGATSDSDDN